VAVGGVGLSPFAVVAQPLSQTLTQTTQTTPPPTTTTTQPVVTTPDGKPFVPPQPPPPSQTRIPGAFDPSIIPPGAPRFTFSTSITLSEQWTDNFFLESGDKTENFRTSLQVGLGLLMNLPNTQGSISTTLGGSYDTAVDDEQFSFFPSFTASVHHTFNPRLSLTVSDTFRRDDDPWVADPNGLRTEREAFMSNVFSVSLNWLIDIFQTQFYYRNSFFISDDTTFSHIIGGNVSMPVGALNRLTGGYEFTYRDTTSNDNVSDSDSRIGNRVYASFSRQIGTFTTAGASSSFSWITSSDDSDRIFNFSLFAAHGIPAGFSVSGSIGYTLFDSDDASEPTHLGSVSLTGSYRFARGIVSVGFFQDARQTSDEGEDFGIYATRGAFASFTYSFTPFLSGGIDARYTRNEPLDGGGATSNSRTIFSAGANLSWSITHWLSLSLDYRYIDRDSDNDTRIGSNSFQPTAQQQLNNSTENRATATLSARF
jgi:hypothetical protein